MMLVSQPRLRRSLFKSLRLWLGRQMIGPINSGDLDPTDIENIFGIRASDSGVTISQSTVMLVPASWCAVNIISNGIKALPLQLFDRLPNGGRTLSDSPINGLYRQPTEYLSIGRWLKLMGVWICTWGNAYAEIVRNRRGDPLELWPIHPSRVTVWQNDAGDVWYEISTKYGQPIRFEPRDILHFQWCSGDGLVGMPPLAMLRQTLGHSVSMQQYGARYFKNGATGHVYLKHPDVLDKPTKDAIRKDFAETYGGEHQHGIMLFENGVQPGTLTFNPEDSQLLQSREYVDGIELARAFLIQPYKLKVQNKLTYNNAEQLSIEFVQETLMPHTIDIEQECDMKLLSAEQRPKQFTEMNLDGLLRGDVKTRSMVQTQRLNNGMTNPDEERARENWNPQEDGQGKLYMRPTNLRATRLILRDIEKPQQNPQPTPPPAQVPPESNASRFARLLSSAVARLSRVESDKCSRAMKKPDTYKEWTERFLDEHRQRVRDELEPIIVAAGVSVEILRNCENMHLAALRSFLVSADPDAIINTTEVRASALLEEFNSRPAA